MAANRRNERRNCAFRTSCGQEIPIPLTYEDTHTTGGETTENTGALEDTLLS